MNALAERIARLIAVQGPISVAQFMTLALHDPRHGYYATRDPLGARGDFVTAPEISQMFGELLGLWCVEVWRQQGRPEPARLVELGPGRGTLMGDLLRAVRVDGEFLAALEIVLIEASPTLRAIQAERLKSTGARLRWADRFDESLEDRPLFLLANEFFDALPLRQYVKTPRGWCERMVTLDEAGALRFALAPAARPGLPIPAERGAAEDGAVYEVAPAAIALGEEIAQTIAGYGGAALIVDYGHDGTGFGETLQAVAAHAFTGLLAAPGQADLSAHVDFAALAAAAERAGATAYGPVRQGTLLKRLGIDARAAQIVAQDAAGVEAARDRLVNPAAMGSLFKALAILPRNTATPPGFDSCGSVDPC